MKLLSIALGLICACASAQTYEQKAVAAVLMGEGWNQGQVGLRAIAEVIHQRSVERHKTPYQVIAQRGAFSCLNRTTPAALIKKYEKEPFFRQQALPLVLQMERWPAQLNGVTHGATHYAHRTKRPWWAIGRRPQAIIGKHAFYRLAKY